MDADRKLGLFPHNQSRRLMRVQSVSVKSALCNLVSLLIYLLSLWTGKLIQLFATPAMNVDVQQTLFYLVKNLHNVNPIFGVGNSQYPDC